jgi:hypothetical protein
VQLLPALKRIRMISELTLMVFVALVMTLDNAAIVPVERARIRADSEPETLRKLRLTLRKLMPEIGAI